MRLLFTPPGAGRRRGQGVGRAAAARGVQGHWAPLAGARWLRNPGTGARCPSWARRPPRGGAPEAGAALQPLTALAPRAPGNLPRGCTRVHTRRVASRGSPGVPRVLPGRGRKPESWPPLAWDSLAPPLFLRPALSGLEVISLLSFPRRGARSWRWQLARGPRAAHRESGSCSPHRCPNL